MRSRPSKRLRGFIGKKAAAGRTDSAAVGYGVARADDTIHLELFASRAKSARDGGFQGSS